MKLVEDAKEWYRWFSMQAMLAANAILLTWTALPAQWQAMVPPKVVMWAAGVVLVGGVIGRLIDQKPAAPPA